MQTIDSELSALNDTIISPIYSWVGPFTNFISDGVWGDACGSKDVMALPFDEQMKKFVEIKIES